MVPIGVEIPGFPLHFLAFPFCRAQEDRQTNSIKAIVVKVINECFVLNTMR